MERTEKIIRRYNRMSNLYNIFENRRIKGNLQAAGFTVEEEDLWLDISKIFTARSMF